MDQNKVNPFSENPATGAGNNSVPVNPYAPAGAPYAPGSNTPPPDYAITSGDAPAVPNTAPRFSTPDPAFTSVPNNYPSAGPEKPKFFTKKFVILIVAGILLIVAAVVTGVILQNNRNNSTGSASRTNTTNELANLLINGESVDTTPELSSSEWYFERLLLSARDNDSNINSYINTVKQSLGALSAGNLRDNVMSYLDCLAVDHYESNDAAKACLSLVSSIKTGVQTLYGKNTEANT